MKRLNCVVSLLIAVVLSFSSFAQSEEPEWQTVEHAGGSVFLDCPSDWTAEKRGHVLLLESPTQAEAVTLSTFLQPGKTLEDFSRARFAVEQEIYKPTGHPREFKTQRELKGRILHSQGIYPGDEDKRHAICSAYAKHQFVPPSPSIRPQQTSRSRNLCTIRSLVLSSSIQLSKQEHDGKDSSRSDQ